jgi:hypothetical protein
MSSIILKKAYPSGYPNDAVELLKSMSFTDGKNVNVVGSMSLRSQVYAGDYDAYEKVSFRGTKTLIVKKLVNKFKSIIKSIQKIQLTYVGDIKSGSVEEWRIIQKPYNKEKSLEKLEELYKIKIISKKEFEEGKKRFIKNPSELDLLLLEQDFRPNIIRWKVWEVLKGFKILKDGRKFTLEEAFQTPTITKLDVMSWVQNNRFTDFSMIYEFIINGETINPGIKDLEKSILENIYVLHSEKKYYKMAKRLFSLAKYKNNTDILEILSPLFNGDLGRLYIVYGDIGTIEDLFEYENNLPYSKLEFEFNQFKGRLSNISLPDYINKEKYMFDKIDTLVRMEKLPTNKSRILNLLGELKSDLLEILSKYTEKFLKEKKIFPKY